MPCQVLLSAFGRASLGPAWGTYHVFGAAVAEVEVDVLTGERVVTQCDLMYDAGRSINPAVDLGQVQWDCWQQHPHQPHSMSSAVSCSLV